MRKPSPSLVVSIIALVFAMAGTATAARVLIKSSSQIKSGAVKSSDIADGTVTSRDIKDGTVTAEELSAATRQALTGSQISAFEAFRKAGPNGQAENQMARVMTLSNLDPGVYAIFAKTVITLESNDAGLLQQGRSASGHCVLDAGGDRDEARVLLGSPGSSAPGETNLQITHTFSDAGTVTLDCAAGPGPWHATDSSVIALKVARAPRTAVQG